MRATCAFAVLCATLFLEPSRVLAVCGDGVRDGTEQCDGADLGGASCLTVPGGFVRGGTLTCNPDCTFNTAGCRQAFIESLVPARGGVAKNRCQLEWTAVGTSAKGNSTQRACSDGDGGCDQDNSFNSSCRIEVQACLNVPDPKVPGCAFMSAPGKVFRVEVLQPSVNVNPTVVTALQSVFTGLARGASVTGSAGSNDVSFSPPVTDFQCGQGSVVVPLRGSAGHARPGKLKLRVRSSDNGGKVRAIGNLTLVCNP